MRPFVPRPESRAAQFVKGPQTAKNALHVLRTALTGAHLLRTGELRVDLSENLVDYAFQDDVRMRMDIA